MKLLFRALIFLVFGGLFILGLVIYKTRPQYEGKLKDLPLHAEVEVLFDEYGIPHIYAADQHDAYVALGYVHAQERLFQMETLRRAGAGKLSEVFGADLLPVDRFFRTIGINQKAEFEAERALSDSKAGYYQVAMAYLKGVNHYIEEGSTPLEFTLAGIPKEKFSIKDMHLIAGAMSYNFALGMRTDPLLQYILETSGPDYLRDILDSHYQPLETIPNWPKSAQKSLAHDQRNTKTDVLAQIAALPIPKLYGSNSWAVAPSRTENGTALFANDTHIGYAQPCTWYEAHLEYPEHQLYGNFMAGIPFALTGHNTHTAWGLTMLLNDDMDLYCEHLNETGNSYLFRGSERPLLTSVDTIHVKDGDDVYLTVKRSHHGPIVTEFIPTASEDDVIAMNWTFLETQSDLMSSFYALNMASDMESARSAVSKISSPGLNISYADVKGNIALWAAGSLTKRPDHVNPFFFLDGGSGEDEAQGYYSFEENPSTENPPWGYIYSANNQHASKGGVVFPGYYEPPFRASRIVQKLDARKDWSKEAFRRLTLDTYSQEQDNLRKDLLNMMKDYNEMLLSEHEMDCLQTMKEWEGEHGIDEIGPVIHYRWIYHIMKNAMQDEIGKEPFQSFLETNLVKSSVITLICNDTSVWWNDISTDELFETREEIVLKSFKEAISELTEQYGEDVAAVKWGDVHQTTHKHPFNELPLVGKLFSVGPFPSPGGTETVNNSVFHLSNEKILQALHGPQMRRVIDMGNVNESYSIIPTGQSGVLISPHYKDQAEMYIKGNFRLQLMNRRKIEKNGSTLMLYPSDL